MVDDEPKLTERFEDALDLAFALHRKQIRKGSGVPYMGHLLGVASIVIDAGGSEDQVIAALLHDAIEDAGGPDARAEIERRFGSHVAKIVDGLTDTDEEPKPPWRDRKERYLAHLPDASDEVLLVSLADKLYNARAMALDHDQVGEQLWERFTTGRDGQLWYLRSLADIFELRLPGPLASELSRTVRRLENTSPSAQE